MQIPILVDIRSPPCVCNCIILIVPRFSANHIAGFADMRYLVPMHPAVVASNCFGATMGIVAPPSSTVTTPLRRWVVPSHHFGEIFVGFR